jgi:trk system potassium uptake protein TrkA
VSATDLILRLIEHEVPHHGLVHLLDLRQEQLEIIEVEVVDSAPAAGMRVSDIDLPEGCLIVSVLRDGTGFVPKSDTVIQPGDEVLAILSPGDEVAVCSLFAPQVNGGDPAAIKA